MNGKVTIRLDVPMRAFAMVKKRGAKDADGDGINEVHTNTAEAVVNHPTFCALCVGFTRSI